MDQSQAWISTDHQNDWNQKNQIGRHAQRERRNARACHVQKTKQGRTYGAGQKEHLHARLCLYKRGCGKYSQTRKNDSGNTAQSLFCTLFPAVNRVAVQPRKRGKKEKSRKECDKAPYLVLKAVSWRDKSLDDLLHEFLSEGLNLEALFTFLGIEPRER